MTIQNKLILLISVILALTMLISGTTSYLQTRQLMSDRLYDTELPSITTSIRNDIEKRLGTYLNISQGIAKNSYVLEWFRKGEDPAGLGIWKQYAGSIVNQLKVDSVTFATNDSRKYYDASGDNAAAAANLKYWFDGFLERGQPYEMVLDKSSSTGDRWKLFTNVRVDEGGKLASAGVGVDAEDLAREIAAIRIGNSGFVYLTTADGTVKVHRDTALVGEANITEQEATGELARRLLVVPDADSQGRVNLGSYQGGAGEMIMATSWIPTIQSFVVIEVPADEIFGEITSAMIRNSLIFVVILALAIAVVFVIARRISSPIRAITAVVSQMTEGRTDVDVPHQDGSDEIGEIAKAVEVFRQGITRQKELEQQQREAEVQAQEEQRRLLNQMAQSFEDNVGGVVNAVSQAAGALNDTAQSMSSISERTRDQAENVSLASEEASTNVQTVAAATDQLTASSAEISHQVSQTAQVARGAVDQADRSKTSIQKLIESAQKIGEVVNLITDIAEQTNLLALNATIEAARAGEAGKGFAVVASEVKALASQTAKATEEIGKQVNDIQSSTKNAADAITGVSSTINQIDNIASSVAAAVEEQTAATQEIARNVEQAANGAKKVSTNIGGVTESSTQVGTVAGDVLKSAQELGENADSLKTQVNRFLEQVRSTG